MNERMRRRWRQAWPWLLAIAIFYAGFESGRATAGYWAAAAVARQVGLARELADLRQHADDQESRLAAVEIGRRVDQEALSEAQRMIGELQAETGRQQQELQFYRGLVARQFGSGNLRVQELKVRRSGERRFLVEVTLVQASARDAIANGTLTLNIDGSRGGSLVQLPLAQVDTAGRKELPFSLRYFQQLQAEIELPPRFAPTSLQVEYRIGRGGAAPIRQTFGWQVEGEAPSPVL